MPFDGEVAIVTGAGKGFGRSIALGLAQAGAAVALVARTRADVEAVATEITQAGGVALAISADVTSAADVDRSVRETEAALGPVTQFVNNAGVGWPYGPIAGIDVDRWWQAQVLHQYAPMLYLSRLLPGMIARRRGRVVIVSARASHMTVPAFSAYSIGKNAQVKIARLAAEEVRGDGMAVFAIDPGFVFTDMAQETMTSPDAQKYMGGMVGRLQAKQQEAGEDLVRCAARVVDLFSGRYDALSGGYFELEDDLDAHLARLAGG